MPKNEFIYSGQDTLEALQEAVNYAEYQRRFIATEIKKQNKKNIKVLDFGAGIGTYADMFLGSGTRVDCVEPDKIQAKILRNKGYKVYDDVNEVEIKYDVVYSLNVFEHIQDDYQALNDIKRTLKKGGVIVVYVPAFMLLFTQLDVQVEHFRRYRIRDLRELARKSDLTLNNVKYCDPIGFFAALAYRIFRGSGNLNSSSVKFFDTFLFPISVFIEPIFRRVLGKNVLGVYSKK